ncbi:MAG: hypothetical protein QOG83_1997 [Alphaproteobacteria bacterium]|nr:hypothetical protein [Alphaproteobacteria bacterium]
MDLSVSPDLEALLCYVIVLLIGAFVATTQIRQRIGEIQGIWLIPRTWWLFAIYTAVPAVLFWFLDRTGAISDTSLFAAVLVGFGYERIITGGSQAVRAPGDVSQFWTPFLAYADRIAKLVRGQDARRRQRLADRIIASIVDDPAKIQALEQLAKKSAPDAKVLEQQLKDIEATAATRGAAAAAEDKVRALYNVMLSVSDGHDLMKRNKIIEWTLYWFNVRGLNSITAMAVALLVVVVLMISAAFYFRPNTRTYLADYYIWRIGKTNSTNLDQFRSRGKLFALMNDTDQDVRRSTAGKLTTLLRRPALPMDRVDLVLQVLLENRGDLVGKSYLPPLLIQSLRGVSIDARTRINDAVIFLAQYCKAEIPKPLLEWKPNDGDSTAALERKVRSWEEFWGKPCESAA